MRIMDENGGSHMIDSHNPLPAARADLELLMGDLHDLSGQLQELATTSRRLNLPGAFQLEPGTPNSLRDAIARLAATLRALLDAGSSQAPGLASSATTQLSALDVGVRAAIAEADSSPEPGAAAHSAGPGSGIAGTLEITLDRAGTRLSSLISHLIPGVALDRTAQHHAGQG
jgi:hypothetical protein